MKDLITYSNYLLLNWWWLILPICFCLGLIIYYLIFVPIFDNKVINQKFSKGGITWDEYGNPIIDDNEKD